MKKLLYIAITILCLSACKNTSSDKVITRYITDTLCSGIQIADIQIKPSFDSIMYDIRENPSYQQTEAHLCEYYSKLNHEIADYNYERAMGFGSGVNKGLIKLYQGFIRNDLNRLNELERLYVPKFKGFGCYAKIRYATDFGDSIFVCKLCLSSEKNKVLDASAYSLPISINVDSLIELDRQSDMSEYDIPLDTTMFIH